MRKTHILMLLLAVALAAATACDILNPPAAPTAANNAPVNTVANSSPAPSPAASPAASPSEEIRAAFPVTMPLLNAMFADDEFITEAKNTVGLTDEEIKKVRDAIGARIDELGGVTDDDERSTRASVDETRTTIEGLIGAEKTNKLVDLVTKRWSGDSQMIDPAQANSIPTDTRVVVNAPAYRMDLFKEGKLVKTYKIGIGYPEFPLPQGMRKADQIIFNPTWTPPDEPWVKGKIKAGETVKAGDKLNPLGPLKIPIGLPSLIHGGKQPARMGTFASHGCVGLTDPMVQDFAMQLSSLAGKEMTLADVKAYQKDKTKTEVVKLGQTIPVELRYNTIVVEDGKVTIYRDVYERGTNTEDNLAKVLQANGVSMDSLPEATQKKLKDAVDQMAIGPSGKPVDISNANTNSNSNAASNSKSGSASNTNSGKVTRALKGKKEIVIQVPELKGKGYPSPVGMGK